MLHFRRNNFNLVEAYRAYVLNHSLKCQNIFLQNCFAYDFLRYDYEMKSIVEIYKSLVGNEQKNTCKVLMRSNGSSGEESNYFLGPYGDNLIKKIEAVQRGSSFNNIVRVSTYYPEKKDLNSIVDQSYILVDFASPNCINFICDFLKDNSNKTHIEVSPYVFMMMCCHEKLLEMLTDKRITVITTGDDAYKHKKFSTIDRMIDWKTGCNFYECKYGGKHTLPIWFEEDGLSYNILNLCDTNGYAIADLADVGPFSDCMCGKKKCELKITSHYEYKPKIKGRYINHEEVTGIMKGKYLNFQILFEGNKARLLVDEFDNSEDFIKDYTIAESLLGQMGFSMSLEKGSFAYVGRRKRPLVWLGRKGLIVEHF
jgi:hypothetical protein